ncbi:MAG: Glycine cleavage system H protein [Candidatus Omnitrophica bacterium ADurb.Bin205]|nr:MAG: Glycine cleavage system H protein [Candidatus Omnitrophica bacterium ADurb.Bin205]
MLVPDNIFFTKDHEWAKIEGDEAIIGITDFAQSSLGDITFIDLPKIGEALKQSAVYATVESVKAASDVYSPLSGKVLRVNNDLALHPELVNKSPYESGWFVVMKIADLAEKNNLMDAKKYKDYIENLSK